MRPRRPRKVRGFRLQAEVTRLSASLTMALLMSSAASTTFAQGLSQPPRRIEASIGGLWLGGAGFGDARAELRGSETPSTPFNLFTTSTRAESAGGLDVRVGYWLTRALAVEAGVVISHPTLRTQVSADAESAPALDVDERLDQYFFDVSGVLLIDALRIGSRTVPFVSGGGGYLRQLHQGRLLVETGQVYHAGGGIRHWLWQRDQGFVRAAGVRADARLYVLVKGVDLRDRPRPHGAVSAYLFVTF
jgi:hypothetical protein